MLAGHGARVVVAVRPEALDLDAIRPPGEHVYSCIVEKTYFLGGAVDHVLNCGGGTALLAQTSPGRSIPAGREAYLRIDRDHAWILHEES